MVLTRPVSPFLTIYRLQVGSFFSIFSRITGLILLFFLTFAMLASTLLSNFLSYYPFFLIFYIILKGSYASYIVSFLFVFVFVVAVYHLLSGLRHFLWSSQGGLSFKFMNFSALASVQTSLRLLGVLSLFLGPCLLFIC
jgi:succinate dehydrogenase / fumarate reductase cytochrome b subunit